MSETGTPPECAWRDNETLLLLADARKLLENCISYEATVDQIASLLVSRLATWCSIDLLSPDKKIVRVAVTHRDPSKTDLAKEILLKYPAKPTAKRGVYKVIETGQSILIPHTPESSWALRADDPRHLQLIMELGSTSYMCVPLIARGSVIGAIMLLSGERTFDEKDLATAEELARSIAMAMDNVYMFRSMQEAIRVRDEFLATLSHEIRTPLNVISGWIQILKTENLDDETFKHALEILDRNSQLQSRLINDLLELSRIKAKKLVLNFKSLNLNELLESCRDALSLSAAKKKISLELNIQDKAVLIQGDYSHLQRMIFNVLTNALKFTPENGKITIEQKNLETGYTQITIIDSGTGIDPNFLPYVFEPFYQESGRTTRTHEGLGLGLAITKQIVEAHHGNISARSLGRNKGAEFIIQLPIIRDTTIPTVERKTRKISDLLTNRHILLVDDSEDIRHLIKRYLEKSGALVTTANSAQEALSIFENRQFDVLLSDICMPEMDGYELISTVRKSPHPHQKEVLAVALTAFARDEEEEKSLSAGFNAHLSKPITAQDLVERLATLLQS